MAAGGGANPDDRIQLDDGHITRRPTAPLPSSSAQQRPWATHTTFLIGGLAAASHRGANTVSRDMVLLLSGSPGERREPDEKHSPKKRGGGVDEDPLRAAPTTGEPLVTWRTTTPFAPLNATLNQPSTEPSTAPSP